MRRLWWVVWLALLVGSAGAETQGPDWQPWSEAGWLRARQEERLVLLDLEAVWCHWCHVMDETTYRDPQVVSRLRESFVTFKVDQDNRPDLAARYADYGWPATVIFDSQGRELAVRSGYQSPEVMRALLERLAENPVPEGGQLSPPEPSPGESGARSLTEPLRKLALERHYSHYDYQLGGWGFTHKFLNPDCLEFSLVRARDGDRKADEMARQTLDAQLALFDPVWGGVYQYSHGGNWSNPHFEKLLSVQADNLRIYALAYAQYHDPRYLKAVESIWSYLQTFLRSPEGAFYPSQDADLIPGQHSQDYFGLDDAGRRRLGVPRVDTHLYARENGWAIESLALAYGYTGRPDLRQAAEQAAAWVLAHRQIQAGGFSHNGEVPPGPFLSDTVACGRGLLALYTVTGDRRWLKSAQAAGDYLATHFANPDGPGLMSAPPATGEAPILTREENLAAVRFLVALAAFSGQSRYLEAAAPAQAYLFSPEVATRYNTAGVLLADHECGQEPLHIVVVGPRSSPRARSLFEAARAIPDGGKRVEWLDLAEGPLPNPDSAYPAGERPTAYVCWKGRCRQVSSPADLKAFGQEKP